jgi:predicted NBD/HSP70 family sugar kinase
MPEGISNLIAVTVSEGIGTGLILNQQLVRGSSGMAGEFGHISVVDDGIECRCGNRGCWEVYASNSAAVRYYSQSASPGRNDKLKQAEPGLSFEDILRLARQNDPKAGEAIDKMAEYLGIGIALLVTGLEPDVIVVVGEITRVWDRAGPLIDQVVRNRSRTHPATRIVPTDPATQPRLRGTIALVLQKHFGAPSVA